MFVIPLKKLRIKNGLTQQELSDKSGIAQGIISGIESGATKNPRFDTVVKLADALNCPLSDFLQAEQAKTEAV